MKSAYKLDISSDRYRICPGCGDGHMVKHRGRDYCSDKCADDHYNQKRRLAKQAISHIETSPAKKIEEETISIPSEVDSSWANAMKANLAILDSITLDPTHGKEITIDSMLLAGFNFSQFSTRGTNHNIPESLQSSFLIFGEYRIYRTDIAKILIKKI